MTPVPRTTSPRTRPICCTATVSSVLLSALSLLSLVGVLRAEQPEDRVRAELDSGFRPALVRADFTSRGVRPGDPVAVTFTFRNDGTAPAKGNYTVFLHFEFPEPTCENIAIHADHLPSLPTSMWAAGEEVVDGPRLVNVPPDAQQGEYRVHVGVYLPGNGGGRLLDTSAGTLNVSRDAPSADELQPTPLSADEVATRRARLAQRLRDPMIIETDALRFRIDGPGGAFDLTDKRTGVTWHSNPERSVLGSVELTDGQVVRMAVVDAMDIVDGEGVRRWLAAPLKVNGQATGLTLNLYLEPMDDPNGIRFEWEARGESKWQVRAVTLLDHAFGTTDADEGYAVVPFRLGEMLPTDSGLPSQRTYMTYSSSTMALYGAVKQGSALLVAWGHPDTELGVATTWPNHPMVPGSRMHSMSLTLRGEARVFTVHTLGACAGPRSRGRQAVDGPPAGAGGYEVEGYVKIAEAYRTIAKRNGWLKTWAEKRKEYPTVDRMFGAADFKPFVLSRTIPGSRFSEGVERTSMSYTFEEAAKCAEHLHRDLEIDQAMYVLAGWIHRGYDNQHPDILPACPECGGNEALADCAKRVKDCGFRFGLHDNYQDMYEDAPSWDEKYLNKTAQGVSKKGGNWAGGQAWQVCAPMQVELAQRPQNLPEVAKLFGPTIYFIDTTFAWGLVTCEDPAHPLTRSDDMKWKSRLCDVAKEHFGLFGSEEGREWAVPHADYFEGLLSHKVSAGRNDRGYSRGQGGVVIPLFELIYGDCINLYTHQGDRATPSRPKYILDCLVCGENALYAFGPHLYYEAEGEAGPLPITVEVAECKQVAPRKFEVTYKWTATKPVEGDFYCFVHFTHPNAPANREHIAIQNDHALPVPVAEWQPNQPVVDGPHVVEVPEQFAGDFQCLIGLTQNGARMSLSGLSVAGGRHHLGTLHVTDDELSFAPSTKRPAAWVFARGDQGWGQDLIGTDRLIKNTYEVLSWVNRLTAESPMTDHRLVTPDGRVEYSAFGDMRIWVNYGAEPYVVPAPEGDLRRITDQATTLPEYGFLVLSPTFAAFHATEFGAVEYEPSAMFTARSVDGKALWEAGEVRVYHGFGAPTVTLCGKQVRVEREGEVSAIQ